MSKYDVVINLSVELDADTQEEAEELLYETLYPRLTDVASRDALFRMWLEVVELREIDDEY